MTEPRGNFCWSSSAVVACSQGTRVMVKMALYKDVHLIYRYYDHPSNNLAFNVLYKFLWDPHVEIFYSILIFLSSPFFLFGTGSTAPPASRIRLSSSRACDRASLLHALAAHPTSSPPRQPSLLFPAHASTEDVPPLPCTGSPPWLSPLLLPHRCLATSPTRQHPYLAHQYPPYLHR